MLPSISHQILQTLPARLLPLAEPLTEEPHVTGGIKFHYSGPELLTELVQSLTPEALVSVYGEEGLTFKPSSELDVHDSGNSVWPIAPYLASSLEGHTVRLRWWTRCSQGFAATIDVEGVPAQHAQSLLSPYQLRAVAKGTWHYLELPYQGGAVRQGVLELWDKSLSAALSQFLDDKHSRQRIRAWFHVYMRATLDNPEVPATFSAHSLEKLLAPYGKGARLRLLEVHEYVPEVARSFNHEAAEVSTALSKLLCKGRLPVQSLHKGDSAFLATIRGHLEQYVSQACRGLDVRVSEYDFDSSTGTAVVRYFLPSGGVAACAHEVHVGCPTDTIMLLQDIGVAYAS